MIIHAEGSALQCIHYHSVVVLCTSNSVRITEPKSRETSAVHVYVYMYMHVYMYCSFTHTGPTKSGVVKGTYC